MLFKRGNAPLQAVVTPGAARTARTQQFNINLFNANGTPYLPLVASKATHQADTVAADLAAMKVDFNALLAKLQAADLMA
jgi:hypothetical protein